MPAEASVRVRTLFAPFDSVTDAYLAFLQSARRSVYIVCYGFTLAPLMDTLIAQHQAGVRVSLILDHTQAAGVAERVQVQRLLDAQVPLFIGTSPVHRQILHSKFTVVDERAVESGSWNYSLSASAQSNTLTFVEDADYARAYLEHFHRLWGFIHLHEMVMQPAGETAAEDAPADALADDPTPDARAATTSASAAALSSPAADDAPPSPPDASAPVKRQRAAVRSGGRRAAAGAIVSGSVGASAHG